MAKTFEQVKQSAIVIKEESRQGRNTAPRVGQAIEDAIDATEVAISAEATARQSAINLEVTAREGAVNGVKSEIEVERNRITVIANRQTATDNALIATNQSISSEAETRANADADIKRSLQAQGNDITEIRKAIDDIVAGEGADLTNYYTKDETDEVITPLTDSVDAIQAELNRRFPFKITSFTGGKVAKKGTTVSASLAWTYDGTPTSQTLTGNGTAIETALTDRSKEVTGITTNTTFTLTANGVSASQSVTFCNPKYAGVVSDAPTDEAGVKALTELAISSSKGYTWTGNLSNQSVCYAYPKAFGALTSIKDANNFDYISGYTISEITVNGEAYYVYTSGKATANNFKQIFG